MRVSLRLKIILITVITPLALAVGALSTVSRSVQEHVDSSSIHESLEHSVLVFERTLAVRNGALAGGTEVIASDPRFFSLLMLGVDQRDTRFLGTVRGMARDMNGITDTDLFEIFDRRGRRLASVGEVHSTPETEHMVVRAALKGKLMTGVPVIDGRQFQVCAAPVRADGRVVGVLMLGTEIGGALARDLRMQMRSEVSFLADGVITATTLSNEADREALRRAVADAAEHSEGNPAAAGVFRMEGAGLTFVTVVRMLPGTDPAHRQYFVMQRAFDPELVFLEDMQRHLWMLALIAIVGAMLTGLLLSSSITSPIRQLVLAAKAMQQGDYSHAVRVQSRDEIGYLAERFNEMRQREQMYVSGLEDSARMKTDFIRIASNELRAPISVIAGYCEMLNNGSLGPVEARQQQALQAIEGCLERLTRVAEHATEVAEVKRRRVDLDLVPHALKPIVERAIGSAVASAARPDVTIATRFDDGLNEVAMDGPQLEEAIAIIVGYALRVSPEKGSVGVKALAVPGGAELLIEDAGPGIPEDRLERLFELADEEERPENLAAARGLLAGLAVARGIVQAHGGAVSARNRPEGGTTYTIRLAGDAAAHRAA